MAKSKKQKLSLGAQLRALREAKSIGIKTVAPKADVTYTYLSKIENDHKVPTRDLLEKLCKIYGVSSDEIVAQFGELPEDIKAIIQKNGIEVFELLRQRYNEGNGSKDDSDE